MRTVAASEAERSFAAILEAARHEPIVIQRQDRDVAVLISPEEFEQLRVFRAEQYNSYCDKLGEKAAAAGLTDEILADILAEPSSEA
jgi:prevent-host-death family protein